MVTQLRPTTFEKYVGQENIKRSMQLATDAALARGGCLGHILLTGPPGLGKTTLANILQGMMGARMHTSVGPNLREPSAVMGTVLQLRENDIWFIDEIHGMSAGTAELLYPLMEDFKANVVVGKDPCSRTVDVEIKPFTLIGATTRPGKLAAPLRDRFGYTYRFEPYVISEMVRIIEYTCETLGIDMSDDAMDELARRSRGTPRIANNMVKRIRDYNIEHVGADDVCRVMDAEGIDAAGLTKMDIYIMQMIATRGPIGAQALAVAVNEDRHTVEEMYEPYLLRIDFIRRTPSGRMITRNGLQWLKRNRP